MIKKFKINKKILVTCTVSVLIVALFSGFIYSTQGESLSKFFGKQQAEILSNAGNDVIATLDGEKITKKGFDTYKFFVNSDNKKLSDKEILDKIIDRQVIYNQALKEGISVTNEELENAIKSAQDLMKSNDQQYTAFKEYVSGLNMTEEQYWESVIPTYQKAITCGKLKNELKEKFAKENKIEDKSELEAKFRDYYDQYVKDKKSKAKVESNLK
jgi:hypothetical protein